MGREGAVDRLEIKKIVEELREEQLPKEIY